MKAYNGLNAEAAAIVAGGGPSNAAGPKAFITILLYDNNYNFVDMAFRKISAGAIQSASSTKDPHDFIFIDKPITEPGYAFIYISNEDRTR